MRSHKNSPPDSGFANTIKQPIMFDGTHSPVKNALFIIICAAWILPGLIGHDPWKPDEASTFGVILSMLHEGFWLTPMIAGVPSFDYPPLYHWVAALTAWTFSPLLPLHDGARLATGLFMALTIFYTHKTAARLFDERAGRISVLLLIGCLGMMLRAHEINPEVAGLAGYAIALYGMTRLRSEPRKGGVTTGIGAGVVSLAIGIVPALLIPIAALALITFLHDWRNRDFRRGIGISLAVMVALILIYPTVLWINSSMGHVSRADPEMWPQILGTPLLTDELRRAVLPGYFLQILPWYGLPALPFAIWIWWRDRAKLRERIELALPLVVFVTLLIGFSLLRESRDVSALTLLIPLALAAASSLDRLPRGLASFMDWFSVVFFGLLIAAAWLYWTAAIAGVPEAAARAVARQAPGFTVLFSAPAFSVSLLLSIIWLYAVIRAHRSNRRAIVNWAAGITLIWVLLSMLYLPAVDYVKSYRTVANKIAAQLPANRKCVASYGLGDAQRASLDYFVQLRFVAQNDAKVEDCDWLLTQGTKEQSPVVDSKWERVWEGSRPADRSEQLRLYRR